MIHTDIQSLKDSLPTMFSGNDTLTIKKTKENVYVITSHGLDHTLGQLLQSHIARFMIDNESVFSIFGYKKVHPLQDIITFTLSFNISNDMFVAEEMQRNTAIVQLLDDACSQLLAIFTDIIEQSSKILL